MMSHVSREGHADKRKSGSDSEFRDSNFYRFELYSTRITWSTSKENRSESRLLSTQSEGAVFFRSRFSSDMNKDTYLNCHVLLLHIIHIICTYYIFPIWFRNYEIIIHDPCGQKGPNSWSMVTIRNNI